MSEMQEEYDKRQRQRKAKALQKAEGIKYTEALRRVIEAEDTGSPGDHIELGGQHD